MASTLQLADAERYKFKTITLLLRGEITNGTAAGRLEVSVRQIKRMKKAVRQKGIRAIVHKLKGRKSNHTIKQKVKEEVLQHIREKYSDFKPGFATEKLSEQHNIWTSSQTTRRWMNTLNLT